MAGRGLRGLDKVDVAVTVATDAVARERVPSTAQTVSTVGLIVSTILLPRIAQQWLGYCYLTIRKSKISRFLPARAREAPPCPCRVRGRCRH